MNAAEELPLEEFILELLSEKGTLSTAEIINFTNERGSNCRDKVPGALIILWNEKKVKREISKERKVLVWSIT